MHSCHCFVPAKRFPIVCVCKCILITYYYPKIDIYFLRTIDWEREGGGGQLFFPSTSGSLLSCVNEYNEVHTSHKCNTYCMIVATFTEVKEYANPLFTMLLTDTYM